jgi:hypothetical protein
MLNALLNVYELCKLDVYYQNVFCLHHAKDIDYLWWLSRSLPVVPLGSKVLLSKLHQKIHLALVTSLIMQSVNDTTSQVPVAIAV